MPYLQAAYYLGFVGVVITIIIKPMNKAERSVRAGKKLQHIVIWHCLPRRTQWYSEDMSDVSKALRAPSRRFPSTPLDAESDFEWEDISDYYLLQMHIFFSSIPLFVQLPKLLVKQCIFPWVTFCL